LIPVLSIGSVSGRLEGEVGELYQVHAPSLLRYAGSFSHHSQGASDAVQEVFLRYFVERRYGRTIGNPRAWLYRVLRNYLLDSWKTAESKYEVAVEGVEYLPDQQQDPESIFEQSQMARDLLALLSARERECLRLRSQGFSYDEIGDVLGLASGSVGVLLARAYRKFRDRAAGDPTGLSFWTAQAIRSLLLQTGS